MILYQFEKSIEFHHRFLIDRSHCLTHPLLLNESEISLRVQVTILRSQYLERMFSTAQILRLT